MTAQAHGRWGRTPSLSFQQLLLLAFLLIGALLGASSLRAVFTLERLMAQSRSGAAQAIELATAAQLLQARSQVLERTARQSLILGDAQLRQRFAETLQDTLPQVQRLEAGGLPAAQAQQWREQLAEVAGLLDATGDDPLERERAVAARFLQLDALNASISEAVQALNAERSSALEARVDSSRRKVLRQVVATLAIAFGLALALGFWLARPFKRLERAIRRLGENDLSGSVEIAGPVDVRRLGRQLDWLRVRLLELDADKARFLRHVSHELKTPLASLREGVALLQDGVTGELNEGQREVVAILRQNTLLLQEEIEALLRFNAAAFEARQLRRQPVELRALVLAQVEAQRLQWQARSLQVDVQGEALTLQADPDKLATALANLLSNAIRFSPRGGRVRFVLGREAGRVRIDLHDEGPGVADNDRPHIFEPFYRGQHQPPDAARGSGVGLSIVREYLVAHGGTVELVDEGPSRFFRIELPDER